MNGRGLVGFLVLVAFIAIGLACTGNWEAL